MMKVLSLAALFALLLPATAYARHTADILADLGAVSAVVEVETGEASFEVSPVSVAGVETVLGIVSCETLWGVRPFGETLRFPGGFNGRRFASSSGIPPLAPNHRYILFMTGRERYISPVMGNISALVFVPDYGPKGAWLNTDGQIVVGVSDMGVIFEGNRPDLIPFAHPRIRIATDEPIDAEPMDPETVLESLAGVFDVARWTISEPDQMPQEFLPMRREGVEQ